MDKEDVFEFLSILRSVCVIGTLDLRAKLCSAPAQNRGCSEASRSYRKRFFRQRALLRENYDSAASSIDGDHFSWICF